MIAFFITKLPRPGREQPSPDPSLKDADTLPAITYGRNFPAAGVLFRS